MTNFWLDDPSILISNLELFPTKNMTNLQDKLNALTRFVILATIVLMCFNWRYTFHFIAIAILIVIVIQYYYVKNTFDPVKKNEENFTMVPTYTGGDMMQTIVSPLFSEEMHSPPPSYDLVENSPYNGESRIEFDEPMRPQSYPYGGIGYINNMNLLPSDEYYINQQCGGTQSARSYANSAFTRHTIAFRDDMSRLLKKKNQRRFRHQGGNDTISPYLSY